MTTPQDNHPRTDASDDHSDLPLMCRPGASPDDFRFKVFTTLREQWVSKDDTDDEGKPRRRTYTMLAEMLGVTKQAVSQWATRSGDKSPPPWHVLMRLCHELGYVIVLRPEGPALAERP